jgi:propionyl-CoA carboxylase alpha chain/3-methylcrotonyl-CoA carboxylase alpha subunit/acetyl-CoA/propionyl-CoA carboxylase biotin carboxyl carrier protein
VKRVLIANRGEIACRIIRTLRQENVGSVAVYHHEDRNAPHVAAADLAVEIESDVPTAAYLDQHQLLAVARRAGCDAIHPGYGFLSENAQFAERVEQEGLTFIGPDAAVVRLMGDKIRAREFAARHGVPIAPSVTQDAGQAPAFDDFVSHALRVGFPLLIKAAAGGGGKGMRIVRNSAELLESARVASSEAQRYFSDPRVYAERYVERPRHIEVQVLGDGKGNVLHLHERECSIQRRYQKIVEESPAPELPEQTREAICEAAVRLVAAARYRNAGTVEFMLAPDGQFYFLEMNTRLQVEHPVTEQVLGIDLVREQLRIARGEGLAWRQQDLEPRGHAIECRICAEEPDHGFRPATGKVGVLHVPTGEDVRFDGGIRAGQAVSPAFDSMLAKLVAWGDTRERAAATLGQALGDLVILGVPTNIDYLRRVIAHPAFLAGHLHTAFLTEHATDLLAPTPNERELAVAAIAAALTDPEFRRVAFDVPEMQAAMGGWRN